MRTIIKASLLIGSFTCFHLSAFATTDTEHLNRLAKQSDLSPKIIELALKARHWAAEHTKINQDILAIVNYNLPSSAERLYVFDLKTDRLIMKTHVAHGAGSGGIKATKFSDQPQSKMSELGALVTGATYIGHHGKSMRLIGVEPGVNGKTLSRAIVIHSAKYVSSHGAGHSWGCLAVSPSDISKLMNLLGTGAPIFSYADQELKDKYLTQEHLS